MSDVTRDGWGSWRQHTPARVALGRSGVSLPTSELLALALAHAQARDAVHRPLDVAALAAAVGGAVTVASAAPDRASYLRRPDLGRTLADESRLRLVGGAGCDLVLVLADGLSPQAVQEHAPPLLTALRPLLERHGFRVALPVIATQARVALGDAVAAAVGARAVAVLIGERPGLSVPSSLGVYLTWAPLPGRTTDAGRNCISNVRPEGLPYADAAARLAWLLVAARDRGLTGVALKDHSGVASLDAAPPSPEPLASDAQGVAVTIVHMPPL